MARNARKANAAAESVDPATLGDAAEPTTPVRQEDLPDFPPAESTAGLQGAEPGGEPTPFVSKLPDPHGRHSIDLGDGRKMRLFLNRRFRQNAIMFTAAEGANPKPDQEDTEWLKERGWRWRNEDRVWTRQLDKDSETQPYARANSDKLVEDQFVELADRIRERKGLKPVEYAFSEERGTGR